MITEILIKEFDNCIKKYCPLAYESYNDTLPSEGIDFYMQKLRLDVNDKTDFKTIYSWKNGIDIEIQDYSTDLRILYAGNFLSLKDILPLYQENLDMEFGWRPLSLIPIMSNYEGEFLLIETDRNSPNYNGVYFYSPNLTFAVDTIIVYDDLESMLKTIINLFENGAQIFDNEKKVLKFDFDLISKISALLNPKSNRLKN